MMMVAQCRERVVQMKNAECEKLCHAVRDLAQASHYRSILVTLATLHAQPRMRPGHPAFAQGLLAVSCEVGPDVRRGTCLCIEIAS